ncbi:hypothetical protein, partial [Klebsiella pneumoniae]|uniref:hypothetical protein n=1 Tax=Klebsiella pneumoniae TaxID=573 RepID=UPI00210CDE90
MQAQQAGQAPRRPARCSGRVPGLMPGGGCALPGLGYGRPVQAQQAGQAPRRPARCSGRVPGLMPGGGCALPGLGY